MGITRWQTSKRALPFSLPEFPSIVLGTETRIVIEYQGPYETNFDFWQRDKATTGQSFLLLKGTVM